MMKRIIVWSISCTAAFLSVIASSLPHAESALRDMADVHPRLVVNGDAFKRLARRFREEDKSLFAKGCRRLVKDARFYLDKPPLTHTYQDRMRMLFTARDAVARITTLAFAYRLTGREEFLRRAVVELDTVCSFPHWNMHKHALDAAEFCTAAALGLDWLHDDLPRPLREKIRRAMRSFALEPAVKRFRAKDIWWAREPESNWNQVLHGGFLAGALLLSDTDFDLSAGLLASVIDYLPEGMAVYAPSGAYPEGPAYWGYGTDFNVLAISMLDSALGKDFGLSRMPGFPETADFPDLMTGTSGLFFNFSDCSEKRTVLMPPFWFARKFNRPELTGGFNRACFLDYTAKSLGEGENVPVKRLFAVLLAVMPDETDASPSGIELPFVYDSHGGNRVIIQRSSQRAEEGIFVGLKGGSPSMPHGHMDAGSFVMDAGGVRWAEDLGGENYAKVEAAGVKLWDRVQGGSRWLVYRVGLSGHNTLTLDGDDQWIKGVVKPTVLRDGPVSSVSLDLSELYTNATSVVRVGEMLPGGKGYRISDRVEGLRAGAPIRWTMHTRARVSRSGGDLLLEQDGTGVRIRLRAAVAGAGWSFGEAPHPRPWDSPNTGVTRICLEMPMPVAGAAELAVTLAVEPFGMTP